MNKRNRTRRGRRSARPRSSASSNALKYYFYWAGKTDSSAVVKNITAGDLKLDLSRPLRVLSCVCEYKTLADSDATFQMILVSDGQEGAVSFPHLLSTIPRHLRINSPRVMDFGLYGTGGSISVIKLSANSSRIVFAISGYFVIEYKASSAANVVSRVISLNPTSRPDESNVVLNHAIEDDVESREDDLESPSHLSSIGESEFSTLE